MASRGLRRSFLTIASGIPLETNEGVWYGRIEMKGGFPGWEKDHSDPSIVVCHSSKN
jgi:hypothetical protein